jgi:uncharacterized protein
MPCCQVNCWVAAACMAALVCLGSPAAHAGARNLPDAPITPAESTTPTIQIQAPPPVAAPRKARSHALESAPLALKSSNGIAPPNITPASCVADPVKLSDLTGFNAASQGARLRAMASGPVPPENLKLPNARQQRAQANAAWVMGLLTLHGICAVLNTADAAVWFERARQLGEPLAAAGLAWCEIEGCKAPPNPAAAGKWIELLRSVDAPRAMYLQWLMQSRLAPMEIAQPRLGSPDAGLPVLQNRQLLTSAARQGDTNAKIELGLDSVYSADLAQALAYFKSAAPRSTAATINAAVMAERLKNSRLSPPPKTAGSAVTVPSQSALDNLAQAQRYHRGQGVPSNYTEAIRLYQLAKNQGNTTASKMLELIFSRPAADGQIDLAWMQQLAQVDLSTAAPTIDKNNVKKNLKREPTPLFELVPQQWRKYAASVVSV